ncbi:hypothetical protein D3C75_857550 [compost metagenome]
MHLHLNPFVRVIERGVMLPPFPISQYTFEVFLLHITKTDQQRFGFGQLCHRHQKVKVTGGPQRNIAVQLLGKHRSFQEQGTYLQLCKLFPEIAHFPAELEHLNGVFPVFPFQALGNRIRHMLFTHPAKLRIYIRKYTMMQGQPYP